MVGRLLDVILWTLRGETPLPRPKWEPWFLLLILKVDKKVPWFFFVKAPFTPKTPMFHVEADCRRTAKGADPSGIVTRAQPTG